MISSFFGILTGRRVRTCYITYFKKDTYECCAAQHYEHKWQNRELTLKCKFKCYVKLMKDPLGFSLSKGNQGTTRGKEKILLTSVGIEPTSSGLDLLLICRLSYEVGQRKSGTIMVVNRGEAVGRFVNGRCHFRDTINKFFCT